MKTIMYILIAIVLSGCVNKGILNTSEINAFEYELRQSPPIEIAPNSVTLTPIPEEVLRKL